MVAYAPTFSYVPAPITGAPRAPAQRPPRVDKRRVISLARIHIEEMFPENIAGNTPEGQCVTFGFLNWFFDVEAYEDGTVERTVDDNGREVWIDHDPIADAQGGVWHRSRCGFSERNPNGLARAEYQGRWTSEGSKDGQERFIPTPLLPTSSGEMTPFHLYLLEQNPYASEKKEGGKVSEGEKRRREGYAVAQILMEELNTRKTESIGLLTASAERAWFEFYKGKSWRDLPQK